MANNPNDDNMDLGSIDEDEDIGSMGDQLQNTEEGFSTYTPKSRRPGTQGQD